MGMGPHIVGVTVYCDFPAEALNIPKVGSFISPDIERIISLNPTIVVTSGYEQGIVLERMRALGLRVFVIDPGNFDEYFYQIGQLGNLINAAERADLLVYRMKEKLAEAQRMTKSLKAKPKVYVQIASHPVITAGAGSYINDCIEKAGGYNIASGFGAAYPVVSEEWILREDPEIIVLFDSSHDMSRMRKLWRNTQAFRNKHIFTGLNQDIFLRPGPRMAEAVEALSAIIADVYVQRERQ